MFKDYKKILIFKNCYIQAHLLRDLKDKINSIVLEKMIFTKPIIIKLLLLFILISKRSFSNLSPNIKISYIKYDTIRDNGFYFVFINCNAD